jgi:hypothetical protein
LPLEGLSPASSNVRSQGRKGSRVAWFHCCRGRRTQSLCPSLRAWEALSQGLPHVCRVTPRTICLSWPFSPQLSHHPLPCLSGLNSRGRRVTWHSPRALAMLWRGLAQYSAWLGRQGHRAGQLPLWDFPTTACRPRVRQRAVLQKVAWSWGLKTEGFGTISGEGWRSLGVQSSKQSPSPLEGTGRPWPVVERMEGKAASLFFPLLWWAASDSWRKSLCLESPSWTGP